MSSPGEPVRSLLRRAPLLAALFCASCGGTAVLLRGLIPMPSHFDLDEKLRFFEQHQDEYDLLFVGSSATFRNYVPEVIDAALAERGLEITSFNFGVVGFRSFETDFMVKWILDRRPKRLRWMVLEPPTFEPPFEYEAVQTDKTELAVHSHTPEETRLILGSIWLSDAKLERKWSESIRHLKLLGLNLGNIGRGPAVLAQRLAPAPAGEAPAWLAEARGFQAVEDRPGFQEPTPEEDPFRDRHAYQEKLAQVERGNRKGASLETYNFAALHRQIAAVRDAGVEPIYCLSPILFVAPEILALGKRGELPHLLAFNLPKSYPELFDPEERIDATHLRRDGAFDFSRFLAPKLADIIASGAQ